jgi:23S rRNA (adenine2503-C2)-methyltransferase
VSPPTDIKDLTLDELTAWFVERGVEPYRARQIFRWIYQRQADTFDAMTDIRRDIRALLSTRFRIARLRLEDRQLSRDGSRKYLFRLDDDLFIESVLIPEESHHTLCISSQVGCAQGCRFCMTARGGLTRNLTMAEITAQIRDIQQDIAGENRLSNIVLMGMGEPLANLRHVLRAIEVMTDNDNGLKFSTRRITVSTAGLVPAMESLGHATDVNLAVSLNATDDSTRSRLMPINRRYPLAELLEACRRYPLRHRRMITFEYILIAGVNDSEADARRLAKLLRPIRAKVNLIPFNEHVASEFKRPPVEVIQRFQQILHDSSYTAIIRRSKGQDIDAACGQLRANQRMSV